MKKKLTFLVVVAFLLCFSSSAFAADVQKQIQDKMQEAIGQESENSFVGNPLETGQVVVLNFLTMLTELLRKNNHRLFRSKIVFPLWMLKI